MIEIFYKKNYNATLFKSLETFDIKDSQNYIPIYKNWFSLNDSNWNNINLNHKSYITHVVEQKTNNKFFCSIKNSKQTKNCMLFFKFSPLLDATKFMVGKYKDISSNIISSLPKLENNVACKKVLDNNNSAYVDAFFSYLTSKTLHKLGFLHGLDFFGSFLAIKKNFYFNIADDLEFLYDSEFFHKHKGTLFDVDDLNRLSNFFNDTRKRRNKICINKSLGNISTHSLDEDMLNFPFDTSNNLLDNSKNLIFEYNLATTKSSSHSSACSSRSSNTSIDSNRSTNGSENSSESGYSSGYTSSTCSAEFLGATIHNFPVQVICLEELDGTLDMCLENGGLSYNEWRSCFFQIIIQLITFQKLFDFTHNDLHTNNIMFKNTDKQFLYYRYNEKHYKVPTHGKIYKIIDFGRSIYKFKGKVICSDSFHSKGDAATQYNCEPYLNSKKPRLEPNSSFDLCRLACSLYDFFVDDEAVEKEKKIPDPLVSLIIEWTKDDKGRNILYKNNGEERYPNFKLYKMIARTVHNHSPQKQLSRSIFKKFCVNRKKIGKKAKIFNIDKLSTYIN